MGFLSWLFEIPNVSSDNSNDYIIPNCWAGPFFGPGAQQSDFFSQTPSDGFDANTRTICRRPHSDD